MVESGGGKYSVTDAQLGKVVSSLEGIYALPHCTDEETEVPSKGVTGPKWQAESEHLTLVSDHLAMLRIPHNESKRRALDGVAHWIEWWPANQWVTGSIPSQGTLGLQARSGPW